VALINCPECNKEVSDKAEACPHCGCGIKPKKTPSKGIGCGTVILFLAVIIIWSQVFEPNSPKPPAAPSQPLTRAQQIEKSFRPLGQHRTLEQYVERNLKDPDSYEHIKTVYDDRGDHLYVLMRYRAKNSFGGYAIGQHAAKVSLDGKLLAVADCNSETGDLCQGITEPTKPVTPAETTYPELNTYQWKDKNGEVNYGQLTPETAKKLNATRIYL
jgi:hypothetical protein